MGGIPGFGEEIVNGVVIGEITRRVELFRPNGKIEKRFDLSLGECAVLACREHMDKLRKNIGDDEYTRLGLCGNWEIREYE